MGGVGPAAAATEPPPIILHSPHDHLVSVGNSVTFWASASHAVVVTWRVKAPGGNHSTLYSGIDHTSKGGVLKSRFTFGPFVATESGWEVIAIFVNDPTGVPSGIQVSATTVAHMILK